MFIKPYPLLISPLLESQSCWGSLWLFMEKSPPLMSPSFKLSSMTNGEIEESPPIPAGNYSLYFSSGTAFILLPTQYGGLYVVLFDYMQNDMPLYVTVNVVFLFL